MKNVFIAPDRSFKIAIALLISVACFATMLWSAPTQAEASVKTESVNRDQITARNPLMIMGAATMKKKFGKTPQKIQIISESSSDVKATYLTKVSPVQGGEQRRTISLYRAGLIDSIAEEWEKGWLIEFPGCTSPGASASITVKYPLVGSYGGKAIGALATYTVTKTSGAVDWGLLGGAFDYPYPAMQLGDSLYSGMDLRNANVNTKISFFYIDDQTPVSLDENALFTIGSLNRYELNGVPYCEWVYASDANTTKFQIPSSTDEKTQGNTKVAPSGAGTIGFGYQVDDWVDIISDSTFYKQSVTVFQQGDSFNFRIGTGYNPNTGDFAPEVGLWWSISSASIAIVEPQAPTKTVDREHTIIGDTLTYTVSQQVHTAGVDIQSKYRSFKFTDQLPPEVDYVEGSAKMHRVTAAGTKTDITSSAGVFAYDTTGHMLTYTFNVAYLNSMLMAGETYEMEFKTLINSKAYIGQNLTNGASVAINDYRQDAEATTTILDTPDPVKQVDKDIAQIGETLTYCVDQPVFSQEQNVGMFTGMQFYDRLPKEVDYVADSATMLQVLANGEISDITRYAGEFVYDESKHTLSYSFNSAYLNTMLMEGETYQMAFEAIVNEDAVIDEQFENTCAVKINDTWKDDFAQTIPIDIPDPVKTADRSSVRQGDEVVYTVEQVVPFHETHKFDSFKFADHLPTEVDYVTDSAKLYQVTKTGEWRDITTSAGCFTYDETARTLFYEFDPEYLARMPMVGETYAMQFRGVVNEHAEVGNEIENRAIVSINGVDQEARVSLIVRDGEVEVIKTSDPISGSMVSADDIITYTLFVKNVGEVDALDIAIFDAVPENTTFKSIVDIHGATYHNDIPAVAWNVARLAPGESTEVSFVTKVNSDIEEGIWVENRADYAQDTPGIPQKTLSNKTNKVDHSTPKSEKTLVKTGDLIGMCVAGTVVVALVAAITLCVYKVRRRKHEYWLHRIGL